MFGYYMTNMSDILDGYLDLQMVLKAKYVKHVQLIGEISIENSALIPGKIVPCFHCKKDFCLICMTL